MNGYQLTSVQEQCLRDQAITAEQPGSVLRDFQMLLDFLGPEGVESGGKYNMLPQKSIGELNQRLSRPIHLGLKRPQLRSHPYLQGLHLLLRASGLSRVEGLGDKARLVLDPALLAQWDQLNPTERYFQLLEAWLRFGSVEMIGESGGHWAEMLFSCLQIWTNLPQKGIRCNPKKPEEIYIYGVYRNHYQLALMDLFGLMEVEHPSRTVKNWIPTAVNHVPFGDAVLTLLGSHFHPAMGVALLQDEDEDEDEEEEEGLEVPEFGAWQPLFQPYFPEWRKNLELPVPEPREGTFIFHVAVGEIWRRIAMPADRSLDGLVSWVLRSVKFDRDHLYEFTLRDRFGTSTRVCHPAMEEGPWTDQVRVGALPLEPGQSMDLHYDFGDDWHFTITLERIEPPGAKVKAPRILEKHGKSPEQYPDSGWW